MTLYIAAGILLSFLVPAYFVVLLADARRLRGRLRWRRPPAVGKSAPPKERPLIQLDGPAWTAPSFCKAETPEGVSVVSFCPPEDGPS